MNLLIFGASGGTGQELVKQSLAIGHQVTAFVRDPKKLPLKHKNLNIIQGNVTDFLAVENAIKDKEGVISALGAASPFKREPDVTYGIINILEAMELNEVKRFIYLSFIGVSERSEDAGFIIKFLSSFMEKGSIADHFDNESLIKASSLDWTIIHPPKLTNGKKRGIYRFGPNIKANSIYSSISRADLADFMIAQLLDKDFIRKTVRVMY